MYISQCIRYAFDVLVTLSLYMICIAGYGCSQEVKDSVREEFYSDGKIKSRISLVEIKNGPRVPHGFSTIWYPSGKVMMQTEYQMGMVTGNQWSWHENGFLSSRNTQIEGNVGECMIFDDSGFMIAKGPTKKGLREGRWTFYYKTGAIRMTCEFSHGNAHGRSISYYESGVKYKEGEFRNGKLFEPWRYWNEDGKEVSVSDIIQP